MFYIRMHSEVLTMFIHASSVIASSRGLRLTPRLVVRSGEREQVYDGPFLL